MSTFDRRVRVLQPGAGDDTDRPFRPEVCPFLHHLDQTGQAGSRRRLAEDALPLSEKPISIEDLIIGDRVDDAAGLDTGIYDGVY